MVKPFSPEEALAQKHANIPDFVIKAINGLLAKKIQGGQASFLQDEAVDAILAEMPKEVDQNDHQRRQYVFSQNLLDFEALYRDHGWHVTFNKKCIGDTDPSNYQFRRK